MSEIGELAGDTVGQHPDLYPVKSALRRAVSRWRFVAFVQAAEFCSFFMLGFYWFEALVRSSGLGIVGHPSHQMAIALLASILAAIVVNCVFRSFWLYDISLLVHPGRSSLLAFCAALMSYSPFLVPLLIHSPTLAEARFAVGIMTADLLAIACLRIGVAWLAAILQRWGAIQRRIYIVTDGSKNLHELARRVAEASDNRIVGVWTLADDAPVEAGLEGALKHLQIAPVDAVIVKLSTAEPERLVDVVKVLRRLPRTILLSPDVQRADEIFGKSWRGPVNGFDWSTGMGLIKLSDRPLAGWRWILKDIQDRMIALLLLLFVSPVMAAIAIGIKINDPGPVLFRQKRRGYRNDMFEMLKFRSMRVAPPQSESRELQLTTRDDPRIFPFGRILRKTSLDELPQLFNVLLGDMWIVGPRPHSPYAQAAGTLYAQAVEDYVARYRIKPGITGWAQVCGWRGPTETREQLSRRVEHDLYYIENWSVLLDMRILCRTLTCAFGHENAF